MDNLPKILLYGAALAFILAIVGVFVGPMVGVPAEGFSRACTNLALLSIGFGMVNKAGGGAG